MQNVAQKRAAATQGLEIRTRTESTVVQAMADHLAAQGVEQAFGVSGGAIALIFDALEESAIELGHFRHETGAAFAAAEAHFATGRPTVVFATTGPGLLNGLTGLTAARWDGRKLTLDTGESIEGGVLYDEGGERLRMERPLQMFTRWYGFALTFPETGVYEP